ncbi:MAG: cytochrome c [Motiliproteus sp.]|nr:cytochrome c [Motiliproteus sp.]MCW9053391.1 cytochrome c [Motiliproteus sp.]
MKKNTVTRNILAFLCLFGLGMNASAAPASLTNEALPKNITSSKPWYSFKQVGIGGKLYQQYCASCHGIKGEGAPNWRSGGTKNQPPAPPLNGTGHTWHHRIHELFSTIKNGTINRGGLMPAWGKVLSDDEIVSVLGWIQSRWPKETYRNWVDNPHH